MNKLTQDTLIKMQTEIQEVEKRIQLIQKEAIEVRKRIDALNAIIRDATTIKSPNPPKPKQPQPAPTPEDIRKYKPFIASDGWIRNKTSERTYNIPPKVVKMALETKTLKSFFEEFGLEIRDNRKKGGALWIKGAEDFLRPFIAIACKKFVCGGTFTKNGYATGYQTGWFTNCKK